MPPFADIENRLLDDLRPAVVAPHGHDGERGEHIQLRQDGGSRLQAGGLDGDAFAQSGKELQLQRNRLLLGPQDFVLVLLEGRRDVAFLVFERLLADVVGRNFLRLGGGDFEVITEDAVEPDFQIGDACAGDLIGLILGDPFLAAAGQPAEFVELDVIPALKDAPFRRGEREFIGEGLFNLRPHVRAQIELCFELAEPVRAPRGDLRLDFGKQCQRACETPRSRGPARPVATRAVSRSRS